MGKRGKIPRLQHWKGQFILVKMIEYMREVEWKSKRVIHKIQSGRHIIIVIIVMVMDTKVEHKTFWFLRKVIDEEMVM